MKRRDFLYFLHGASWTTIFWGWGQKAQAAIEPQPSHDSLLDRFRLGSLPRWQNTAAPTARKFALLVGVNHYADSNLPPLAGCLTDLELQHQLLCHRYGFAEQDILILADQTATLSNVQAAVTEHLINQVQPGDVVVCHFSSYGTQIENTPALVLFDRPLLLTQWTEWLRSLPTPYITTILDTSFTPSPPPISSNLSDRFLASPSPDQSPDQSPTQSLTQSPEQDSFPPLPGVVIRATSQGAKEKSWDGFSAGVFTYAFTQQLWQTDPSSLEANLEQTTANLKNLDLPSPPSTLNSKANTPAFFLSPDSLSPAHGSVITADDDKSIVLWLGGLPPQVLANYGLDSLLEVKSLPDAPLLQVIERSGLQAKAKVIARENLIDPSATNTSSTLPPLKSPPAGTLLQEVVRVLPHNISLQIAFDRQLSRVERVDATSAFANIKEISLSQNVADYLFTTKDGSYGLSTLAGHVLPTTQGQPGEAAKSAVSRLKQQLHHLLATKLLHLTENTGSLVGNPLGDRGHLKATSNAETIQITQPQIQITQDSGNSRQYLLENKSDRPLWGLIFCSTPELGVIVSGADSEDVIYELPSQAKVAIVIPEKLTNSANSVNPSTNSANSVNPSTNSVNSANPANSVNPSTNRQTCHTYGIFSTRPLTQTSQILKAQSSESLTKSTFLKLATPLAVIKAVYQDLQTPEPQTFPASASDSYILEVDDWVTFWL